MLHAFLCDPYPPHGHFSDVCHVCFFLSLAPPAAVTCMSKQGWFDRTLMPGVAFDLPNGCKDKPNPKSGLISRLTNIKKVILYR